MNLLMLLNMGILLPIFKFQKWNFVSIRLNYNRTLFISMNEIQYPDINVESEEIFLNYYPFGKVITFVEGLVEQNMYLNFSNEIDVYYKNFKINSSALDFSEINERRNSPPTSQVILIILLLFCIFH